MTSVHHNQNKDIHKVTCVTLNGSDMFWSRQKNKSIKKVAAFCFFPRDPGKRRDLDVSLQNNPGKRWHTFLLYILKAEKVF